MKRTLLLTLFIVASMIHASIVDANIAKIILRGTQDIPEEKIRAALMIQEGDEYDPAHLEHVLANLKKWGRFAKVEVQKKPTAGGMELTFVLEPGVLVGDIQVSGNYPLLAARVRRSISIRPGDLLDPDVANEQIRKIEQMYVRLGYEGTQVELVPTKRKKGFLNLHYKIHKGDRYSIGQIEVTGNTVFPMGYFVSQINPLLPYEPGRLRKSVGKIRKGYHKQGYLGARVRVKSLTPDPKRHTMDVALEITEGDKVNVQFTGNHRVSIRTFHKVLTLFTEGGYGSFEIETSREEMIRYYREHGFQDVQVSSDKKSLGPRHWLVSFDIREGIQTRVKNINVTGNQEVSDRKLKRDFVTKEEGLIRSGYYRPATIDTDFKNIPDLYRQKGYREAEALDKSVSFSPLQDQATVTFAVKEGQSTQVGEVHLNGPSLFPQPGSGKPESGNLKKRLKMTEGATFSEEGLARDKEILVNYYADRGHPYVIVLHQVTTQGQFAQAGTRQNNQVALSYQIDPGPLVTIDQILVVGNQRTTERAVQKALSLKTGQPFSYKKLLRSETTLRRLGAFRSVSLETIGLTEHEEKVHLLVKLEENKSIVTDLEISYNTDQRFTGVVNIQHLNLFGIAKRANLKFVGGQEIRRGELNVVDPHFAGRNWEAVLSTFYEQLDRPGFDTNEVGGSIAFLHDFTSRLSLLTKYQIDRTFFSNVTDPTEGAEHDNTTSKTTASVNYDTRDSYSDPKRGYLLTNGMSVANKITSSGSNFLQPKTQFVYYYSLSRFTLFNFFRGEGIKVLGAGNLNRDDRLFLGGDYSIRGFDEDRVGNVDAASNKPIGGHLLLSHTAELQARLAKGFKLAAFVDSGSLTDNFKEIGTGSFRHSAGVGLRYVTPIGPLRLDYGIKLDRRPGESFGRLHFAFGYLF